MLMWSFSWHYEGMKEDALQKGLPAPDEAAVRELVLAKNVEAPDLTTVKDFLRFKAAAGKGMITEQTTCDSLNTFTEWFFAGFTRVTDTEINKEDRSEVYDVSIFYHLMARPDLILTSGSEKSCLRKASSSISRGQSIILPSAMFVACYELHRRRTIRSLFLSVTGSSFTIFFSSITGLELNSLYFSPAGFATKYVYRHWFMNRITDCIGYRPCFVI
jgi:hypothetical protein